MPLFNYKCKSCGFGKEHFIAHNSSFQIQCPKCNSKEYSKRLPFIKMDVEYVDQSEYMEKKVQPHVNEVYEKIGREAMNEDTKTAENIFGAGAVENTLSKHDD